MNKVYKCLKMNAHSKSTSSIINISHYKLQTNENLKLLNKPSPSYLPVLRVLKPEMEKKPIVDTEQHIDNDPNKKSRNFALPLISNISTQKIRRNSHLAKIQPLPISLLEPKKPTIEVEKNQTPKQIETKKGNSFLTSFTKLDKPNQNCLFKEKNLLIKPTRLILNNKLNNIFLNTHNYIVSFCSQKGSKSINQDSILIQDDIFNIEHFAIFSVFDGHGSNGHFIANFVKKIFTQYFSTDSTLYYIPRQTQSSSFVDSYSFNLKSLKKYVMPDYLEKKLSLNNFKIITSVYNRIERELKNEIQFDTEFSGTTACSVFIIGKTIICSNIGDSRAILIHNNNGYKLLSNDHKPNLPQEKSRIMKMGGEVRKGKEYKVNDDDAIFPYRVYKKGEDYPGLAMSRSLGDLNAKSVGVSNEPEIVKTKFQENDLGIVIASDGLWEYVSNEEVVKVITKNLNECQEKHNCDVIVNELQELARERFLEKGKYIDDISIIVILRK